MTELDPNRVTFVRREYRDFEAIDPLVNARNNDSARTITIVTSLNAADAQALADKTLAANKVQALAFEITFVGTMSEDRLAGQCPTARVTLPKFKVKNRLMRVYDVTTDYDKNTTTVRVRG